MIFPPEALGHSRQTVLQLCSPRLPATDTLKISKVGFMLFFITVSFRKTHCQRYPGKDHFSPTEFERAGVDGPWEVA